MVVSVCSSASRKCASNVVCDPDWCTRCLRVGLMMSITASALALFDFVAKKQSCDVATVDAGGTM